MSVYIRPDVTQRCRVALCPNTKVNMLSKQQTIPFGAIGICDDCLKDAVRARFGTVYIGAEAIEKDVRIIERDAEISELKYKLEKVTSERDNALKELEAKHEPYAKIDEISESALNENKNRRKR